ncbi:MAG: type II secretion system F family protein [Candidatus Omnitrophota bacterium]|jgi:tight adherence protein C
MEILIYLLLLGALALIMLGIFGPGEWRGRPKLPELQPTSRKIKVYSFLARIFPFTNKILEKLKIYNRLKARLDAAHAKFTVQAFFNLKILLIIGLMIFAYLGFGKLEPGILVSCLALGYVVPDIILNRMIVRRKYAIARLLPETVDLLGLCVEAGLDFTMAVKWILEKTPMNPMLEELAFVLEEIKWGKSRTQALKDMSRRLNIPEVSSFVQTLVLAERMGTPVAEAFAILSEDTRLQRFHRGERIALQAPMKILIPLIFCILPVIVIIIGGPIFLDFMTKKIF